MLAAHLAGCRAAAALCGDHGQMWALPDAMPAAAPGRAGRRGRWGCGSPNRAGWVTDVDFMSGIVHSVVQWPAEELKTEISRTRVPILQSVALELAGHEQRWPGRRCTPAATAGSSRRGRWTMVPR
jgi:hypothetical protein